MDDLKGYELDEEKQKAIDGVPAEAADAAVPVAEPVAEEPPAPDPTEDVTPSEPEEPAAEGEGDEE